MGVPGLPDSGGPVRGTDCAGRADAAAQFGPASDSFVISSPLAQAHPALALLVSRHWRRIGAATGMVIVASVALSTMVSNDMLLPWLLRYKKTPNVRSKCSATGCFLVRRVSIVVILLLAYVSYRLLGLTASLATIVRLPLRYHPAGPHMLTAPHWEAAPPPGGICRPGYRDLHLVLRPWCCLLSPTASAGI